MIITTLQTAWVMAWALWDGFFTHYGFPTSILSDQGHNFESNLIKGLCDLGGICKIHTTPYHMQWNGQCKWFNSTLISMTGTLQDEEISHWGDLISTLVHTHNCTKSNTTEFSLYYLMFEWEPKLGLSLQFG